MAIIAQRTQGQGDYTGKLETFAVDAAHARIIAPGDVVLLNGSSDTVGRAEIDNFANGAIATLATGVVASIEPQFVGENLSTTALAASTEGSLQAHIDPNVLFLADSDGTLAADDVGLNVGFNALEATTSGGLTTSNYTIDSSSVAVTATLPFRIAGLAEDNDGVLGNRALVTLNDSTLAAGSTGV